MILAIDPGTNCLGYAIFTKEGNLLKAGSIKPVKAAGSDRRAKSISIVSSLLTIASEYAIMLLAIEEPLLRGVANKAMERLLGMLELQFLKVPINYYAPMTIKATMGSGSYDKEDMFNALKKLFPKNALITSLKGDFDAIDAICAGITYFNKSAGIKVKFKKKQNKKQRKKGCNK